MAETQGLKPSQQRAIAALLSTRNVAEAAEKAQVGERTLYRWMGEAPFKLALLEAEAGAIDAATRRLIGLQDSAIGVLEEVLNNPECFVWARLTAARSVLDYLLKLRELRNVEERLAALEAMLPDLQGRQR
jgi:hypothetical protein